MLQCRSWILLMWKARESIASDNARDTLVKFIHQRWESLSASQTAFLRPLKLPKTAIPANCDRKRHSFLRKDVVPDVYKFSTRFCYVSIFSCQKFSFMAFGFFGDVFLSFTPNTFIPFLVNVWVFLGREVIWSIVFTRVLNQFKDIHALGFRHSPLLEKVNRHTKQGNTFKKGIKFIECHWID